MVRNTLITVITTGIVATSTVAGGTGERFTAVNMDTAPQVTYGDMVPGALSRHLKAAPPKLTVFVNPDEAPETYR